MSKLFSMVAIAFALFVFGSMLYLFKYNVETSGTLFAVLMVMLPMSTVAALIIHYIQNK